MLNCAYMTHKRFEWLPKIWSKYPHIVLGFNRHYGQSRVGFIYTGSFLYVAHPRRRCAGHTLRLDLITIVYLTTIFARSKSQRTN